MEQLTEKQQHRLFLDAVLYAKISRTLKEMNVMPVHTFHRQIMFLKHLESKTY